MKLGAVIGSVVQDHYDPPPPATTVALKQTQKCPERMLIELVQGSVVNELSVRQSHCAKVADTLASGVVIVQWISDLRSNPHPAARTVLLEVDLV